MKPELMNALTLAYIGDAVFEVRVRDYLVNELNILKVNDLQKASVLFVSAKAQAAFIHKALEEEWLSEDEVRLYKRGRNTKGHNVKNKSILTHNQSSGFEAVIGYLHMIGDEARIDEIFEKYVGFVQLV